MLPVVEALATEGVPISIDTRHASVARAAVAAGALLLNDVSASLGDLAADLGVGWVAMHCQGTPQTMQDDPRYDDVVAEVRDHLVARAEAALAAGVQEVWIDPGIGFGKDMQHNLALLAHLDALVATGHPVMVGVSRKGFIGQLTGVSDGLDRPAPVDDRLDGSVALATWAATLGARMVRAHDVAPTVHALSLASGEHAA